MTKLPVVSGRDVVRILEKVGFWVKRQRGSHVRLYHQNRMPVTVPMHRTLDRGTLRSILRTVEMTPEEFTALL